MGGVPLLKLLLDTHIWIWSLIEPKRLSKRVSAALTSKDNELWLSSISVWEMMMLVERRRIDLDEDLDRWLDEAMRVAPVREAPVTFEIARASRSVQLPRHDPADRFIAATAMVLDLTLLTADQKLAKTSDFKVLVND